MIKYKDRQEEYIPFRPMLPMDNIICTSTPVYVNSIETLEYAREEITYY